MRQIALIFLISGFTLVISQPGFAKGEWEVGLHYGGWNLSFLESYLEDVVEDTLGDELKKAIIDEHPEKSGLERDYHQELSLDSTGYNFGVEIRFYPAGKEGSFSLGLSVEKTEMRLNLEGSATDEFGDESYFDGSGSAKLLIDPISYHLSFRWDIKPSGKFHPYFGLGFGLASLRGYLSYEANGDFYDGATGEFESEAYSDKIDLGILDHIKPKITPVIVQLNIGLKYEITDDFHFLIDAGIWNGFLLRGGVAFRL
ncbi:MAG: hypothetical protein GH145_02200 [Firmicutes bacterium]|nr:hypothetical protein [Bacillota bacterium]